MTVTVLPSTALPLSVVRCCTFKHNSVTVINPQHGHCASTPITVPTLGGWKRNGVCYVKYIYKAQTVTRRGSGHLLPVFGCGWYVNIANCFLIRCESVTRILKLYRDHYRAGGNLSALMDDGPVSRNFNIKTQALMGRWGKHQTDGFVRRSHVT